MEINAEDENIVLQFHEADSSDSMALKANEKKIKQ